MKYFLQYLPKIELHAHLNGSLSIQSIQELDSLLHGENTPEYLAMAEKLTDFNNLEQVFQKFNYIHQLTKTVKGLQLATTMVIRDFSEDNVIYLELRSTPKCNNNMSRGEYLEHVIKSIQDAQRVYNIIVKLIVSIDRSQPYKVAEEIVNLAIDVKHKYPEIVKGLDLSGNPMRGNVKDLLPLLSKAKDHNLLLALHCAEVRNVAEAQEMLDFGFQRLGHGTFLTDQQFQQCSKQNITVECCLSSNVKSGTVPSYKCHHFRRLHCDHICKVVLCTDDSGIFDTNLTQELVKACEHYNLNRHDIYSLSINAVEASFADEMEKTAMKEKINNYFAMNNE